MRLTYGFLSVGEHVSLEHLLPLEGLAAEVADEGEGVGVQVQVPLEVPLQREALRALGALIPRLGLDRNAPSAVVLDFVLPSEAHRGEALAAEGAQDSLAPFAVRPSHVDLGRCDKIIIEMSSPISHIELISAGILKLTVRRTQYVTAN